MQPGWWFNCFPALTILFLCFQGVTLTAPLCLLGYIPSLNFQRPHAGNFRIFFCSPAKETSEIILKNRAAVNRGTSYVDGTVRVVVFVICKVRKILWKMLRRPDSLATCIWNSACIDIFTGSYVPVWFIKRCVQREKSPNGKPRKNTKCLEGTAPHGCLTKQRRLLPGKGIFTENKKKECEHYKESWDIHRLWQETWKMLVNHVILKQNWSKEKIKPILELLGCEVTQSQRLKPSEFIFCSQRGPG